MLDDCSSCSSSVRCKKRQEKHTFNKTKSIIKHCAAEGARAGAHMHKAVARFLSRYGD